MQETEAMRENADHIHYIDATDPLCYHLIFITPRSAVVYQSSTSVAVYMSKSDKMQFI